MGLPWMQRSPASIHVDINDLGAVLHLLARHGQGFFELAVQDEPREGLGAGNVGALAHVDEERGGVDGHGLKARKAHRRNGNFRHGTHLYCAHGAENPKQVSVVAGVNQFQA